MEISIFRSPLRRKKRAPDHSEAAFFPRSIVCCEITTGQVRESRTLREHFDRSRRIFRFGGDFKRTSRGRQGGLVKF